MRRSCSQGLDEISELEEVTIRCSFLEIYKEVIQDLLNPSNQSLRIREEKNGSVYVQGLSDEYVSSARDIMQLLAVGEKSRTVASTDMNEVSSSAPTPCSSSWCTKSSRTAARAWAR